MKEKKYYYSSTMQNLALEWYNNNAAIPFLGIVKNERPFLYSRLSLPKLGYSQCAVYPTFPLLIQSSTLQDKSKSTSTNSHNASTELHSTTSRSRSLSSRSSSRNRRRSSSRHISASAGENSRAARLCKSCDGLEVGGRAIRVLEQAGGSGGLEGFGAGCAEADGVGGGAARGGDGGVDAGDLLMLVS
jgi:hypothetical protein